jgi:hypothetical protein
MDDDFEVRIGGGLLPRHRLGAQRAQRLLDLIELPMTEVALQAGFRSLRRCNPVLVEFYRRLPTQTGGVHRSRDRSIRPQTACPSAEKSLALRVGYERE